MDKETKNESGDFRTNQKTNHATDRMNKVAESKPTVVWCSTKKQRKLSYIS